MGTNTALLLIVTAVAALVLACVLAGVVHQTRAPKWGGNSAQGQGGRTSTQPSGTAFRRARSESPCSPGRYRHQDSPDKQEKRGRTHPRGITMTYTLAPR